MSSMGMLVLECLQATHIILKVNDRSELGQSIVGNISFKTDQLLSLMKTNKLYDTLEIDCGASHYKFRKVQIFKNTDPDSVDDYRVYALGLDITNTKYPSR